MASMLFSIKSGQEPTPILPFDRDRTPILPDNKEFFGLEVAAYRSGISEKELSKRWAQTWEQYVNEDGELSAEGRIYLAFKPDTILFAHEFGDLTPVTVKATIYGVHRHVYTLDQAAKRFKMSEDELRKMWHDEWDDMYPPMQESPADDPAATETAAPAAESIEPDAVESTPETSQPAATVEKSNFPDWDGTDDHGHPVRVGSLVIDDGEGIVRVTQMLPGLIIGKELRWREPLVDKFVSIYMREAKRDLTVIEDPAPGMVTPQITHPNPKVRAVLDLVTRISMIENEIGIAASNTMGNENRVLKECQEHLDQMIGNLTLQFMHDPAPDESWSRELAEAVA